MTSDPLTIEFTPREKQVLELASQGYTAKMTGEELCISKRTVEMTLSNAQERANTRNTCHTVAVYVRQQTLKEGSHA